MLIYGASGHAKVIMEIIKADALEEVDCIFDDDQSKKSLLGIDIQHAFSTAMEQQKTVIAIGNNKIRKTITEKISNPFCKPLIHTSAVVSDLAKIAEGSVVMAGALINPAVEIGKHCIINTGAVVEHDVQLEDFVHISPNATITGNVEIGEGTQIGAGSVVIPGTKIGSWVTVGAGAVVIEDIPDFAVVVGNPGRIIKFNNFKDE